MDVMSTPLSATIKSTVTVSARLINAHNQKPKTSQRKAVPNSFIKVSESILRKLKSTCVFGLPNLLLRPAVALTYEEALQQDASSSSSSLETSVNFDFEGFTDSLVTFARENSVAIAAGVALVGLPLVLGSLFFGSRTVSARDAYFKLEQEAEAQLVDIRQPKDIKEFGSPDIRNLRKRAIQVTYNGDAESFLKKLSLKFKDPENTTVYILDSLDGNSSEVAKLIAENGFKSAYAIKDGSRGWQNSGLPWLAPRKAFALDISDLQAAVDDVFEDSSGIVPVTLGVAAATGVGIAALSEMDSILQLLGSAVIVQFSVNRLLFAKDRKKTMQQVNDFLDTKVAPKELVDELKEIGKAFLPEIVKVSTTNGAPIPQQQQETAPVSIAAASGEATGSNSPPTPAPKPASAQSLSPYPNYPDFKPPTSPCPSQP